MNKDNTNSGPDHGRGADAPTTGTVGPEKQKKEWGSRDSELLGRMLDRAIREKDND